MIHLGYGKMKLHISGLGKNDYLENIYIVYNKYEYERTRYLWSFLQGN